MDCLDNERRPHFPQFSYSASGREWTVHHGDTIAAGLWGHQCGTKRPTALDRPRTKQWLEGFCPSLPAPPLFFTSPVQYSINLFIYLFIFVNPFLERTSRQNYPLILHCIPRWSEPWCDQLLRNVPLMTGASPVACCALTCVSPTKLFKKNKKNSHNNKHFWSS